MSDIAERETSSLDEDAGPGSQGVTDPGPEGDFTGEPMDREETSARDGDHTGSEAGNRPSSGSEPPPPGG